MDRIAAGRALVGDSLGYHLLLVTFGVGLPVLIAGVELYGILTHRPRAIALAHTWSKALVVLFIAGAVSGTIVSLQFDLLWPKFMSFISKTVGVAFALEGSAFMVEALFLSVYMLSWNRVKPWLHWVFGAIVALSAVTSAFFITSANAFMNNPVGFTLDAHGNPTNIHVTQAIFTQTTYTEVLHSVLAYICTTALALLAVYAWLYRKKRHAADRTWMRKIIVALCAVGLAAGVLVGAAGDISARYLAAHEPYKLAAAEVLQTTQTHAPLIVGGVVSGSTVKYGLKIPSMLSFLATHNFAAEVQGLDKTPPQYRPPVFIHYFFDGMVGIGMVIVVVPLAFLVFNKWHKRWAWNRYMLGLLVLCGFLAMLATEFGWLVTEFGRQPWIIHGVMLVGDALTTSTAVIHLGYIFPTLFLILLVLVAITLRKTMNHKELNKL